MYCICTDTLMNYPISVTNAHARPHYSCTHEIIYSIYSYVHKVSRTSYSIHFNFLNTSVSHFHFATKHLQLFVSEIVYISVVFYNFCYDTPSLHLPEWWVYKGSWGFLPQSEAIEAASHTVRGRPMGREDWRLNLRFSRGFCFSNRRFFILLW